MSVKNLKVLLDNMEQIERFFCQNCSNANCTIETRNECTVAFAILAKNTSWGFVLEELMGDRDVAKKFLL
ncbi:MAG: hypothetical protein GY754_35725 [bacterium]|nr:hypothetical protein [bacterium]